MQHIMVAHDLSVQAETALHRAVQLARQHGARLTVLHVQEDHLPKPVLEHNRETARRLLDEQLARLQAEAELVVATGRPAQTLVAQQKARSVDLLVMGDHHQESPLYFSGTTLERVLQHSTAAVLLAVDPQVSPYQLALVPLDFSRCACNALHRTRALLADDARIHAVHVLEKAQVHGCSDDEREWQAQLLDQLVADEQAHMPAQGASISHALLHGELHGCLAASIDQLQPQLLALGKHGRGEMADALLGSLARYFLENPPCDLLLTR
ncbi:MAG: universal stress protein [Gammaproteobacteria bacterium]|nr:universal stress protein [Gammaproteobacteria bacterium]